MYISGIGAGIQSQHTTVEMFLKYQPTYADFVAIESIESMGYKITQNRSPQQEMLFDWAKNHKTTIIVNGGYSSDLNDTLDLLQRVEVYGGEYPFACFKETEDALNGALTNVGVILPEEIFNFVKERSAHAKHSKDNPDYCGTAFTHDLNEYEIELAERVAKCKLMN
jgi:hypothetical protein